MRIYYIKPNAAGIEICCIPAYTLHFYMDIVVSKYTHSLQLK